MINWILGGLIIGITAFVIYNHIRRMSKGETSCCSGCTSSKSSCCCEKK